jgi:hypothetical protein
MTEATDATAWDCGGLHFAVSFRPPAGATLRVSGDVDGARTELLRFDDFVDAPHYHVPAAGDALMVDREAVGEPLDFYVVQLRDHLGELLTTAGYERLLPAIDVDAVAGCSEQLRKAMIDCVPDGYVRVPGVGLQRAGA